MSDNANGTKVLLREKIGIFLGAESGIAPYIIVSMYLMYFYSNVVGLNVGIVGSIILVSKLFDGISDIFFGNLVDKTKSRFGSCRAWLLRSVLPVALSFVLLFLVPSTEGIAQYVYVFLSYNFFVTICYTIQQAAAAALPTFITRDKNAVGIMFMFKYLGIAIFAFITSTFTMTWIGMLGNDRAAWVKLAAILAVITIVTQLTLFLLTEERVDMQKMTGGKKIPLWQTLKAVLTNKYWIISTIVVSVGTCIQVSMGATTTYFAQYILGDVGLTGTLIASFMIPPIIAYMIVGPLMKKYTRRGLVLVLVAIGLVGQLLILLAGTNIPMIMVGMGLKGSAYAPIILISSAMLSDSIEYGHWKTGIRAQAVIMSAKGIGEKLSAGLVSAVIGWVMAYAGYDGMAAVQVESANNAISGLFCVLPFVFLVIIGVTINFYKLDKEYPQIMKELNARLESGAPDQNRNGAAIGAAVAEPTVSI